MGAAVHAIVDRRGAAGAHLAGDRWFVDETYVKVAGVWSYLYRAVDQHGQVIYCCVSKRRDIAAARTFFTAVLTVHGDPGRGHH